MTQYPLEGYRVVDFGTAQAGPQLGHLLADMGAEVIKVESRARLDGIRLGWPGPGGVRDPERQPAFHGFNRSKLSITVDIKRTRGLALIKELIKISHVVTENFSPGVLKRNGLDYESLKEVKQDIILVSQSAAGQDGPLREILAYAPNITALAGMESLIGYVDEAVPYRMGCAYGDSNAAIHGFFAVLVALYYRNRTGEGQHIDVSQWEVATTVLGEAVMDYTMNDRVLRPQGNRDLGMAPHNNYPCNGEDRWVSIAVNTEEEWQAFCEAIGNPSWTKEERFADRFSRLNNQEDLDKLIGEWAVNYTPYQVTAILQKAGVAAAPVMNIEDRCLDPHHQERKIYVEVEHPKVGKELLYGIPWKLSETAAGIRRHAPLLGEHNAYVFKELLGLSQDEIDQLIEDEVLA